MYMQYNHETRKLNTSMLANMNSQAVPQIRFNTGRRGTIACKPISSDKNNNFKKILTIICVQRKVSSHNSPLPSTILHITLSHNTRMSYQKFIKLAVALSGF